ncbi:hypothetical protein BGX27_002851 [Mortierella sp. AM989]|nr:hypothetical protein BGX27_002851 [Mortierella sp. AM989]
MTRSITAGRINNAPSSVYYLPDFITPAEEQILIDKASGIVNEKGMIAESLPSWLSDMFPRFQESAVFDSLDATHRAPNHCLVNEYLPGQGIMPHKDGPAYLPTVATVSLSSHCVLEFYKVPEEEGEKGNQDREVLSGSPSTTEEKQEPVFSLLVQPRSLLVLKEDVYNKYMHGIREITVDDLRKGNIVNITEALPEGVVESNALLERGTRISLTFRIVQKTLSSKKIFLRR